MAKSLVTPLHVEEQKDSHDSNYSLPYLNSKFFELGEPELEMPQIVFPTLEGLALTGHIAIPNTRNSPVPGHDRYDLRTVIAINTIKQKVIVESYKIPLIKELLDQQRSQGIDDLPDIEKHFIPVDLNEQVRIAQALLEQKDEIREKIAGIESISFYMHTKEIDDIIREFGFRTPRESYTSTFVADNKCVSSEIIKARGLAVPEGKILYTREDVIAQFHELKKKYNEVSIRIPYGSTGQGIRKATNLKDFEDHLDAPEVKTNLIQNAGEGNRVDELTHVVASGEYDSSELTASLEHYLQNPKGLKVEGWIVPPEEGNIRSLGITMYLLPDKERNKKYLTGLSEQIIKGADHGGNKGAPNDWHEKLDSFLNTCSEFLCEIGAYGYNGVDLIIVEDKDGNIQDIVFMEFNPRETGQTHLLRLTKKLEGTEFPKDKYWVGLNVPTIKNFKKENETPVSFDEYIQHLKDNDILYTNEKKEGVIVLNWLEDVNKGMIYITAFSEERRKEIREKATFK